MTLTKDEIEFFRREAQIPNNTFSCADMLRVLDAIATAVATCDAHMALTRKEYARANAAETALVEARKWEACGALAWSALTETSPDDATPEKLLAEATAIENALMDTSAHRVVDCIAELRAKYEADAAAMREALDAVRRQALYCLEHSGEERDDAVRDLDIALAHPGFRSDAGVELLDELKALRARAAGVSEP